MGKQASYLEGFLKGLSMDMNSDCGKAIKEIVNCISSISDEVDALKDNVDDIDDRVDNLEDNIDEEIY